MTRQGDAASKGLRGGSPEGTPLATELTRRFRREWRRSILVRGSLHAVGAFALIALMLLLLDRALLVPASLRHVLRWLPLLGLAGVLLPTVWRAFPGPGLRRIALLVEERGGEDFDQLLSTALDLEERADTPSAADPLLPAFARRAEERLRTLDPGKLLPRQSRRRILLAGSSLGGLLLFTFFQPGGAPALWAHWSEAPPATVRGGSAPAGVRITSGGRAAAASPVPSLGALRLTVTPPAYTGLAAREVGEGEGAAALPGSRITIEGRHPGSGAEVDIHRIEAGAPKGGAIAPFATDAGWRASWSFAEGERGVSVELSGAGADGAPRLLERKVLPIATIEDRPPEVELRSPEQDLLLASPEGSVTIRARARDDYGVSEIRLSWIHSSGGGESFSFEEGEWEWDRVRRSGDALLAEVEIDLAALGLRPGDVLHIRAFARDSNTFSGPGEGVSATRLIRVARDDEMGDVTTLIGFPIERDRHPLLSQRMIILLTEELIEEAAGLDRATFLSRSRAIADEQARLKSRVEEQIFMRAAGAMDDPEAHLEHGGGDDHGHDEDDDEEEERRSEDAAAGFRAMGDLVMQEHAHDSSPILGINDNLLAAYNSMWESERHLLIAEPNPSLPHQYRALARLQTLREGDRVYARGRTRTAPVDVSAARGTGKIDDARPVSRRAGSALPSTEAWLAEVEGLIAVVPGLNFREASAQASALAVRILADPGGSPEAARLLSDAAERIRVADGASDRIRAAAQEEGVRLLVRAAELLVPGAAGGTADPIVMPSTPVGARYLRILRDGGSKP